MRNIIMQANTLDVNGIKMHYLEQGLGRGPLLLFLHGFPEGAHIWTQYLEELSDKFHVVAPDLRGYGKTSRPEPLSAYALELLMLDVVGLIKELGYAEATVIGHDWGGLLAWYAAAHHPDAFTRLIIMNGPHPKVYADLYDKDEEQKRKSSYISVLVSEQAEAVFSANDFAGLKAALFETSTHSFSAEEREAVLQGWRSGLGGGIKWYQHYFPRQTELAAAIPQITTPTLVLWGEIDNALSMKNTQNLESYVSNVKVKIYPKATHWLTYEIPAELIRDIREFCQ